MRQLVGFVFVVAVDIKSADGRIRVGDSLWIATGKDCAAGSRVRVVRADWTVLKVVPFYDVDLSWLNLMFHVEHKQAFDIKWTNRSSGTFLPPKRNQTNGKVL